MKVKAVILANEIPGDQVLWEKSCARFEERISYRTVNLLSGNWLEEIQNDDFDILLAKPGAFSAENKKKFDERAGVLVNHFRYRLFPSLDEILIYENKRYLAGWLDKNNIPHPSTNVIYDRERAGMYIESCSYPIVGKLATGASGSGVTILRNREDASRYISRAFGKGLLPSSGPKLGKGKILRRIFRKIIRPGELFQRIKVYYSVLSDPQKGFCIFQEFIPHDFEWRVVRIGNSFYAHKKLVKDGKASGSLLKEYADPPLRLLDFVKDITDKHSFYSQAVDIFETADGRYLVNEMQCIFGQSDPYQMLVGGKPGRYLYENNSWRFEEGMFNTNECFDERIEYVLSLFEAGEKN